MKTLKSSQSPPEKSPTSSESAQKSRKNPPHPTPEKSENSRKKSENPPFAPGTSPQKLAVIFIVGSLFGCFYEMILNFVTHLFADGTIFWETRSAVIYGPFGVVYGFGAVLMTIFLVHKDHRWWQTFLYGALLCGACEYILGFLQETFTGTISWDYGHHLLNINHRTSVEIMLVWGVLSLLYVYLIFPAIDHLTSKLPFQPSTFILNAIIIFLCFDMAISLSAVIRQHFRHQGIPTLTPYGEFLDDHYPDARLREAYPNMQSVED